MSIKWIMGVIGCIFSTSLWSFTCYLTVAKGSCWKKYNVTIQVIDVTNSKVLTSINVPSGEAWTRQSFACEPAQRMTYHAQFTPVIWETDKGKVYKPFKFLALPEVIKPGEKAWVFSLCFPSNFNEVPLPPDAGQQCGCDFNSIPPLPPQ